MSRHLDTLVEKEKKKRLKGKIEAGGFNWDVCYRQ